MWPMQNGCFAGFQGPPRPGYTPATQMAPHAGQMGGQMGGQMTGQMGAAGRIGGMPSHPYNPGEAMSGNPSTCIPGGIIQIIINH